MTGNVNLVILLGQVLNYPKLSKDRSGRDVTLVKLLSKSHFNAPLANQDGFEEFIVYFVGNRIAAYASEYVNNDCLVYLEARLANIKLYPSIEEGRFSTVLLGSKFQVLNQALTKEDEEESIRENRSSLVNVYDSKPGFSPNDDSLIPDSPPPNLIIRPY